MKAVLFSLTNVPPERQKIVGLTMGKLPGDEQAVVKLGLGQGASSKPKEFMMMYAILLAQDEVGVTLTAPPAC